MMRTETKKYKMACKNILPFYGRQERAFLKRITTTLETKNGSYDEICKEMGSPKDTVLSYMETCDDDYLLNKAYSRSHVKFLLIFVILFLFIAFLYNVYMLNLYQQAVEDQQIIEYTEYITEY